MEPFVVVQQQDNGAARVVLQVDGEDASECWIVPFTIRIGAATVRMDGIGGVETKPIHRMKGYSKRVLQTAVQRMREGDAAITMLYGISDFYYRFGYVTAGPEYYFIFLHNLDEVAVPKGWTYREFSKGDLPAVRRIYNQQTALATGTAIRSEQSHIWTKLSQAPGSYPKDECWVAVSPEGEVRGYAWRAQWCWPIRDVLQKEYPESLTFGEVVAETPLAADTLLAVCRMRTREEGRSEAQLPVPPDSVVANAARCSDARFEQLYQRNGGSMIAVLNTERLLKAMEPEFTRLVRRQPSVELHWLTIQTDAGAVCLRVSAEGVQVTTQVGTPHTVVHMPQGTLGRLAVGFAPAHELCARLPEPPNPEAMALLELLFPPRHQHMYLPDRY